MEIKACCACQATINALKDKLANTEQLLLIQKHETLKAVVDISCRNLERGVCSDSEIAAINAQLDWLPR